jgi:hypothetical protein
MATVSDNTSLLRLIPEGEYIAFGTYGFSGQEDARLPVESSFTLSQEERLLILDGSFSLRSGSEKHGFKMELELPRNEAGKGYFVFTFAPLMEIVGVLGQADSSSFMLAGRSKKPPTQLACRLYMVDDRTLQLEGLLAYKDFEWVTWSLSMKSYDPQLAKENVVPLRRA